MPDEAHDDPKVAASEARIEVGHGSVTDVERVANAPTTPGPQSEKPKPDAQPAGGAQVNVNVNTDKPKKD